MSKPISILFDESAYKPFVYNIVERVLSVLINIIREVKFDEYIDHIYVNASTDEEIGRVVEFTVMVDVSLEEIVEMWNIVASKSMC